MRKILLTIFCTLSFLLNAEVSKSDEFMRGYLCSKLENRYNTTSIDLYVINPEIIVTRWPANIDITELKSFLEECCPNFRVRCGTASLFPDGENLNTIPVINPELETEEPIENLLPELNPFFPTMLAQPHMLGYSVGYRSYDKIFKPSIPVSIGDQFSLFQFKTAYYEHLYFGIEACVWAIFDARARSLSLINADYFVALPLTYIKDNFSARLRVFHQSSHLGDEFLLDNPRIKRTNPSMEVIDLSLAYDVTDKLQIFMGYSRVLRSDPSFRVKPNKVYYGFNYSFEPGKIQIFNVEAYPYIAAYFSNDENNRWMLDSSAVIGYQWNKSYGHKLRLYVMGHTGFSAEGQFARRKSEYISLNLMYGY